jgi:signal transduction histidine kinase
MLSLFALGRYFPVHRLYAAVGVLVPSLLVLVFRSPPVQGQEIWDLFFLGSAVAASVGLGLVARERHAQLEALAERAVHAEIEREQRARMAVLAERAGFSREMHDIVGHNLAVIVGLADGGVRQVEANPERGRQVFELIGETGRQALADLRRTLGALRERPLDEDVEGIAAETLTPQPGVADIAELLERTRSAGPRVSFHTRGEPTALPRSTQLAIYRIVQESLTNSLKHAGPDTSVQVVIDVAEDSLGVTVVDTGPEFRIAIPAASAAASPADAPAAGQGLTGVRERAALAGGRAEAGSNSLGGWTVTARFPLASSMRGERSMRSEPR